MNADRAEGAFWAAFLRNRNVDAVTADDGAVAVAGGYAICITGTLLEYGVGAGSSRPLRRDDADAVASFYGRRGLPPRLELGEDVIRRDAAVLDAAGYAEEDVSLAVLEAPAKPNHAGGGATVRLVTRQREWVDLHLRADETPGAEPERLRRTMQTCAAAAHGLFVADVGGVDVGAAAVAISGDTAYLYAGAVLPAYRGQRVHGALIAARLAFGQDRGVSGAAMKTVPDSAAERSALRAGFTRTSRRRRVRAEP